MRDVLLVTGGAGFIGSNFILSWMEDAGSPVVSLDLLTYAGNPANLSSLENDPRYLLARGDICDAELVGSLLREHRPRAVVHFAAESHVDRSIASPGAFIRTNVQGTFVLLEQAKAYWSDLSEADGAHSGSCTSPPTKFTARWGLWILPFQRPRPTLRTVLMRHRRQLQTTWQGPISIPGAFPCLPRTAPTITAHFNFPRSSFHL